jgi:hypothetical protein
MWSIASSSESTIRTARIGARYSARQSSSVAGFIDATSARERSQPRSSTPFFAIDFGERNQHVARDAGVHEQRLHRVARRVALRLRVVGDRDRHRGVRGGVDVDVAHAVEVLDDRDLRLARDALDQALAAARHDDVDVLLVGDQVADRGAIRRRDDLHRRFGQIRRAQPFVNARRDRGVAAQRFRAAAQDRRVAGLEAQRGRVGRHVRARLVDDADDAERHAHQADLDAGGPVAELGDLADRVGERDDVLEAFRHRLDRLALQRQAVDERGVRAGLARGAHVFRVRRHQLRRSRAGSPPPSRRARGPSPPCRRARARATRRARLRRRRACTRRRPRRCPARDGEVGHRRILARRRSHGPRGRVREWLTVRRGMATYTVGLPQETTS